jgi:DNA-binding CsgD family transcriptional regulator
MDQVVSDHSRVHERLEQVVSALGKGIILIDADGQVVWMDANTRRRVNGGLQHLELPIARTKDRGIDCFAATVDVRINGERTPLCIIQETGEQNETGMDLVDALEAIMADTSWFTRTLIDKVKAWRQAAVPAAESSNLPDLDALSGREREILGLICEGRGDGDMSRILNLSRNTVRNHIASLYRKIGVNRRSAAIIWARERGITSHDAIARKLHVRRTVRDAGIKPTATI